MLILLKRLYLLENINVPSYTGQYIFLYFYIALLPVGRSTGTSHHPGKNCFYDLAAIILYEFVQRGKCIVNFCLYMESFSFGKVQHRSAILEKIVTSINIYFVYSLSDDHHDPYNHPNYHHHHYE